MSSSVSGVENHSPTAARHLAVDWSGRTPSNTNALISASVQVDFTHSVFREVSVRVRFLGDVMD